MKKVSFKNSKNLNLVGNIWPASSNSVVIMVHGSGGNRLSKGLFEKIADSLQKNNYNVLNFDFSGHGESDDALENMENSIDDLNSAIKFVKENGYKKIALIGHSYGAFICLKCFSKDIKTMVLLGPLTGPVNWNWERILSKEQIEEVTRKGYFEYQVNDEFRQLIKIDANIFKEILQIDQEKVLTQITAPVLLIHGNGDKEELDLLEFSKKALKYLPKGSELKIINSAQHNYLNHENEVIGLSLSWFKKHFKI